MILGLWWLKPPWKPILGFSPLGCCFGSCTTRAPQSCCNHNWIDGWKVNYQFLRNSTVYAPTLLLLQRVIYTEYRWWEEAEKAQKFHLFSRLILQVIEYQKWKDLKYYLVHDPYLKEEKNLLDGMCLVWSQKGRMTECMTAVFDFWKTVA